MPMHLKVPTQLSNIIQLKNKWLEILRTAQETIGDDAAMQQAAKEGKLLKERWLPPEAVGRSYVRYCALINSMYHTYLDNVQLQRAPYILDIITVILKRLYELRDELVHIIVNDYVYADKALQSFHMTPVDIEIIVPYHFPLECRSDKMEQFLQQMWRDALKRKKKRERPPKELKRRRLPSGGWMADSTTAVKEDEDSVEEEEESESPPPSVHTIIPENFIHVVNIQRHERLRVFRALDAREKAIRHKQYFSKDKEPAPMELQLKAALLIQDIYRRYMMLKRKIVRDNERDMLLGILPNPNPHALSFLEENTKIYERRRNMRLQMKESYLLDMETERTRLIMIRKDDHIEDITEEVREWFKEWFYGYGFFPQYPYEIEGGTILVVREDYPSIEEKLEEDEIALKTDKGKTKEELKQERARIKEDQKRQEIAKKLAEKKALDALVKLRCDPFADPGYKVKQSEFMDEIRQAIRTYRLTWSLYDECPAENFGETIYGYLKPLLCEDLMKDLHLECRKFVDELMRIDLKMLIQKHQQEYKHLGWKYPKVKPRKRPHAPHKTKIVELNEERLKSFEQVFDLNVVSKPTTKFSDIYGDSSYAAYDYNIRDPHASFPLPGYGDIKNRLMLSCVFGCGMQPGAPKNRAVMLLGPIRNGKTFLADAVCGEINAVKIDISPEVFSAMTDRPQKAIAQVFAIARVLQPAVIFMRNIERVFMKKVPADQKYLKATSLKGTLGKLVKAITPDEKIIFIATCSDPWVAQAGPMLNMFDEVLLVPRADYASIQQFFFEKFQSIKSMPRDFPTQPIGQLFQGYGFADVIDIYNEVMTPERIIRLNIKQLSAAEFIEVAVEKGLEPLTAADYQTYVDFFIDHSSLKQERIDYAKINFTRAELYSKMAKKMQAEIAKKARASKAK